MSPSSTPFNLPSAEKGTQRDLPDYDRWAPSWQLSKQTLTFGKLPLLMGIVNVTPDSFSDGGRFLSTTAAIRHGIALVDQGSDILDIGGESTRPYATPVSADEELRRVVPVIEELAQHVSVPISIDTSKSVVAHAAIAAGAQIINDVTGLAGDPQMLAVARETRAGICIMHMQGTPATMQENPRYVDAVAEILAYLRDRRDATLAAGIGLERICIDVGLGFGKSLAHNLALLGSMHAFHQLSCPVLVGHSRKGFLRKLSHPAGSEREAHRVDLAAQGRPVVGPPSDGDLHVQDIDDARLPATIGVACAMAGQRVQILRVHDVRPIRDALQAFAVSGGRETDRRKNGP